jgi:hypothetical protein
MMGGHRERTEHRRGQVACNCGDRWAHGGHADLRLRELSDALGDRRQGLTLLGAVEVLIAERDALATKVAGLETRERALVEQVEIANETITALTESGNAWADRAVRAETQLALLSRVTK